jgi:hypothetical protein
MKDMPKYTKGKHLVRNVLIFLTFFLLQFGTANLAFGRPFRMKRIPDKGKNFGCATCHISPKGGGERNAFGRDFEKYGIPNGNRYSKELGMLDSDGDGFTNDEEFAAMTNPGDAGSRPDE